MNPTVSFGPISADMVTVRALASRGRGFYELGTGARFTAPDVFGPEGNPRPGFADCSGFVAWAAGYRRGDFSTNGIVADALGPRARFRQLEATELVRASDVIVKAGPDLDGNGRRDYPGHVGIITRVLPGFRRGGPEWWKKLEVTHCSGRGQLTIDPSTGQVYGAVRTDDAAAWRAVGYIVRAHHVTGASMLASSPDAWKRIALAVGLVVGGKVIK